MPSDNDELLSAVRSAVEGVNARWDRQYYLSRAQTDEPPWEMYRTIADQRLFALGVPEEYGGGGAVAVATVMEAMSRGT